MGTFLPINYINGVELTKSNILSNGTLIFNRNTLRGLSSISTPIYHFSLHPYPYNNSLEGYYLATTASPSAGIYGSAITVSDIVANWQTSEIFTKYGVNVYVYNFTPGNQTDLNPVISTADAFASMQDMLAAFPISTTTYPITYSYTNSTVSGPTEAAVGDTVTVSAVPDVNYGITDASTQILVTNNDIAVPYTWDATNQRITFTMPDPS